MNSDSGLRVKQLFSKQIVFIVLGIGLILLVPLLAMQVNDDVNWGIADFAAAGVLLLSAGILYVLLAKMISNAWYRAVLAIVIAMALFLVWAELAVGVFGTPFAGT